MSQQQNTQVRDALTSSQLSREDEEICSNKATISSDRDSDDSELLRIRSRSSERRLQRPMTRGFAQHLQTARTSHPDTPDSTQGTSSSTTSSLIGLTLTPLPSAMLPSKKRSIGEVLGDESPPEKDKMSAEIDQLAGRPSSDLAASSSGTQNATPTESRQRKKRKASGESSTSRALPIVTRNLLTTSDERGNEPPGRRSERIRDATRSRNPPTSD
ncbi:hypothetical protein F5Y12DRAFT_551495 [Xylaria sp. FL1777]|nr:hypothetical protein F5Y12DRAFT_551495 [Xylaria sp. FL1777]